MADDALSPWAGRIGWCHACETVQTGDEARWRPVRWDEEAAMDWVCVNCDAEPWGFGVWPDQTGYDHAYWTEPAKEWRKRQDPTGLERDRH